MRIFRLFLPLLLVSAAHIYAQTSWHDTFLHTLPYLGRHNWIVIADPAYPLVNSTGVDVVNTGLGQADLLTAVLDDLAGNHRVRPTFFTDSELPFVSEDDAPGIGAFRAQLGSLLKGADVTAMPEADIIPKLGESYRMIILKSTSPLPYSSIFIQLNSGYWSDDAERRLRLKMQAK
jgi:hypothetical protein